MIWKSKALFKSWEEEGGGGYKVVLICSSTVEGDGGMVAVTNCQSIFVS